MAEKPKQFIYDTAANGLTVRIPADKYEVWRAEQDKIRAGTSQADPQTVARLRSLMGGK